MKSIQIINLDEKRGSAKQGEMAPIQRPVFCGNGPKRQVRVARPKPTNKFYDCNPDILEREIPKQFKFRL